MKDMNKYKFLITFDNIYMDTQRSTDPETAPPSTGYTVHHIKLCAPTCICFSASWSCRVCILSLRDLCHVSRHACTSGSSQLFFVLLEWNTHMSASVCACPLRVSPAHTHSFPYLPNWIDYDCVRVFRCHQYSDHAVVDDRSASAETVDDDKRTRMPPTCVHESCLANQLPHLRACW